MGDLSLKFGAPAPMPPFSVLAPNLSGPADRELPNEPKKLFVFNKTALGEPKIEPKGRLKCRRRPPCLSASPMALASPWPKRAKPVVIQAFATIKDSPLPVCG